MLVLGCCTSTYYFADMPHWPGHGSESRPRFQAGTSGTKLHVYAVVPQTELTDQYDIQGTFRLSHFLIRVLLKCGCIIFMLIIA